MRLRIKINGKSYEAEVEILDSGESAPDYPPYPPAEQAFVPATLPEPPAHAEPRKEAKRNAAVR